MYHTGDTADREQETPVVQESVQCSEAVVVRPAQSALPRIFCNVANQPSSTYLHPPPHTTPSDPPAGDNSSVARPPIRRSQRFVDSQTHTVTASLQSGSLPLLRPAESADLSPSDHQVSMDSATRNPSAEPSVSPAAVKVEAHTSSSQPASVSVLTSGDASAQLTLRREQSVNLGPNSGLLTQPAQLSLGHEQGISDGVGNGRSSPFSLPSVQVRQLGDSVHLSQSSRSDDYMRDFDYQSADLCQAGSCNFDSLPLPLPSELPGQQAYCYTNAAALDQPQQQTAWFSGADAAPQADNASVDGVLPQSNLPGSIPAQHLPSWGWSVITGQERQPQYIATGALGSVLAATETPAVQCSAGMGWEKQAWQDAWQHQHHHHHQQQQAFATDQWAVPPQPFDQWQPNVTGPADAVKNNEPALGDSEASWWMLPYCDLKNMFPTSTLPCTGGHVCMLDQQSCGAPAC